MNLLTMCLKLSSFKENHKLIFTKLLVHRSTHCCISRTWS